jgi:hypothetical protein
MTLLLPSPADPALDSASDFDTRFELLTAPAVEQELYAAVASGQLGFWENLRNRAGYFNSDYPHPFAVRGIDIAVAHVFEAEMIGFVVRGRLWALASRRI